MSDTTIYSGMPSDLFSLERVRYFPRMLITSDDMTAEQNYFRNKLRRHNRFLHGWGVVCGCKVLPGEKPYEVKITPGYVLGPYGDEIVVWKELTFDIRTELVCGCSAASANGSQVDPWCSEVKRNLRSGQSYYIAIKYKEMDSRFVRALPLGCNCDQARCEASRILDCFVITARTTLPTSHDPDAENFVLPQTDLMHDFQECPQCPSEPWVVLADVTLNDNNLIEEEKIDNCCHRRWVLSLANLWWKCPSNPSIRDVAPNRGTAGTEISVTVNGCNFVNTPTVKFGNISIDPTSIMFNSPWKLTVQLNLMRVNPGVFDITVQNPGGNSAVLKNAFQVVAQVQRMATIDAIPSLVLKTQQEAIITIKGKNFREGSSVKMTAPNVTFKGVESISANEIRIRIRPTKKFSSGLIKFDITDPDGRIVSGEQHFKVNPS